MKITVESGMLNNLLVAVGGAMGAVLRYRVALAMKSFWPGYAASGTLIVNVIGSLIIGYYLGISHESKSVSEAAKLFFIVGVVGGLTTFSSLAYETVALTHTHQMGFTAGLGHLSANLILGLGAVFLGAWLGRESPPNP